MKRVKLQPKKPINALFEKWLLNWKKEAAEQGLEKQHTFNKALKSLQKFPLPVKSGKDCIILENFGAKICELLDKELNEYRKSLTDAEWQKLMSVSSGLTIPTSSDKLLERDKPTPRKHAKAPAVPKPAKVGKSKSTSTSDYVPRYRSGAYGILVALFQSAEGQMTKARLQDAAQNYCDSSFTKPMPGSHYTAWSSMAILVKQNLVTREGRPLKFKLTETGRSLAERLSSLSEDDIKKLASNSKDTGNDMRSDPIPDTETDDIILLTDDNTPPCQNTVPVNSLNRCYYEDKERQDVIKIIRVASEELPTAPSDSSTSLKGLNSENNKKLPLDVRKKKTLQCPSEDASEELPICSQMSTQESSENFETFFLFPGTFKIILLVDVRETEMRSHTRVDVTIKGLERRGVTCETRHLTAGDFVWVARDNSGAELLLPYIVERKRFDDLSSSIKDGRFHEQKFRLKASGVPNIIYLLEKHGKDTHRLGLPLPTLQQAAANTQVVDEFIVKVSKSHDDSMMYLSCLTKLIVKLYKDKTLVSCEKKDLNDIDLSSEVISLMPFKQFLKESTKTRKFTVKEMLVKHLVQLKGMSVDKATVIADKYSTPIDLIKGLQSGGEKSVADLQVGALRRLGPALAKSLYQFYTQYQLS